MTHRRVLRPVRATFAATAIAGGCMLLAGCAAPASPKATSAPRPTTAPSTPFAAPVSPPAVPVRPQTVQVSAPAVAVAPVSAPSSANPASAPISAAPSPAAIAAPAATTPADPEVVSAAASAALPPHFATPDAAMRYLVAAYNSGDETAIRHVTTPDSRDQFESERQWVKTFRFRDCTANGAPNWDYSCVLDIIDLMPGVNPNVDETTGLVVMDEVTLIVGPAARPGYYLEANEGCGG